MSDEHDDTKCLCDWHVRQRALVPAHDATVAHAEVDRPDDN